MVSAKNLMLSPAATDLGMGDQLKQQVEDTVESRRKKTLKQVGVTDMGMSAAGQSLFQGAGSFSI